MSRVRKNLLEMREIPNIRKNYIRDIEEKFRIIKNVLDYIIRKY